MENQPADPWAMNPNVTTWLAENLSSELRTVELGGGSGSMLLHENFPRCCTVEHDPGFARMLRAARLTVLEVGMRDGWYEMTGELPGLIASAELLVVDGPIGWRRENIKNHTHHIQPGTVVVFDDSHRSGLASWMDELRDDEGWTCLECIRDGRRTAHIMRKP